jgi:hypothetical protein
VETAHKQRGAVTAPAVLRRLIRDPEIDDTALSLVVTEKGPGGSR